MISFPSRGRRLDWILISPEFEFVEYRTLPDVISDHRAVVATLKLVQPQTPVRDGTGNRVGHASA
jgi:endonuclease/exonuclease/phosphatase family metal-dependent hydrolase